MHFRRIQAERCQVADIDKGKGREENNDGNSESGDATDSGGSASDER
jgi:hypothetical protein